MSKAFARTFSKKKEQHTQKQHHLILLCHLDLQRRPALHNQYDLIKMRTMLGIPNIYPGITGWAQVNGRDTISIAKKVELDKYYLNNRGLYINVKIIFLSFRKVLFGMDVEV